jgi:hypothetical protein
VEWVAWVLFESLPALGAMLFTANFVLLVYWRRRERVRPLLIGLAVAVVLLGVQALVETRREAAMRILAGIEQDVRAAQTESLAAALSPSFDADGLSKAEFLIGVQVALDHVRIHALHRGEVRVREASPDQFVVSAVYLGDVEVDAFRGPVRTRWDITFVRGEPDWQISAIRPRAIEGLQDPSWRRILHE